MPLASPFVLTKWAHIEEMIVFSDKCGRQFKLTRFSLYLMKLSERKQNIQIGYHFYPSCHEYGVCDAMGAQGQRTIRNLKIDTKAAIETSTDLSRDVLRRTKNHHTHTHTEIAPQPSELEEKKERNIRDGHENTKVWWRQRYK